MDALSIAIAFLAILTPGAVLYGGIMWLARRRDAKIKAAQDKEAAEQAERQERMAAMRKVRAWADKSAQAARQQPSLRAVPKAEPREVAPSSTTLDDPFPFFAVSNGHADMSPPAAAYSGGGGTFDGGGASGDWGSSSGSCSSSDNSSSSDSGSCGSGD